MQQAAPGGAPGTEVPRLAGTRRSQRGPLGELATLEVAHEELRAAEEELRSQQEQITQLAARYETERRWRSQLAATVPVGLAVTDGDGLLVEVNPAFADQLGVPLHRLHREPLAVYLAEADQPGFRSALRALASGAAGEHRATVTLRPHPHPARPVQLLGFPEAPDPRPAQARVQWVLMSQVEAGRATADPSDAGADDASAPGPSGGEQAASILSLAASFAQLSALPVGGGRERVLGRMAALVRAAVPAADWASITVGSPVEPLQLGSDSTQAQACDGLQQRLEEGPCLDAYTGGQLVVTPDLTADGRWSTLARLGADGAVRSVLAIPLRQGDSTTGVINLYAGARQAFGPAGRGIAEVAAGAVVGVLRNLAEREAMETLAANLEKALATRAVIDQAKGMLMARLGIGADDAFARLVALSSRLNVKVRELARMLIEGETETVIAAVRSTPAAGRSAKGTPPDGDPSRRGPRRHR